MSFISKHRGQSAFTLIELLVVMAVIGLLLSIILPALRKAKLSAQSIICRNHLRTLALANEAYASLWDNWYVPVIDTTMTDTGEPTWNSNTTFRTIVGLEDATNNSSFIMPEEYLCPVDTQSDEDYWAQTGQTYQNYVSYGYNFTDWGSGSKKPATWSGNIPFSDWSCRFRVNSIRSPGNKIMFVDAGDWSATMAGADYQAYWDQYGQDIVQYRQHNMWSPVYYRHSEGVNIAYFDGHVDLQQKASLYYYDPVESETGDTAQNELIWFCNPSNRKSAGSE